MKSTLPQIGVSFSIAAIILFTLLGTYILGTPAQFLGVTVSPYHLPVSFVAAVSVTGIFTHWKRLIISAAVSIVIIAVCIWFFSLFYDYGCDGHEYHLVTTEALANEGWNTFLSPANESISIYSVHYPMVTEWIQACIYSFTGNLNAGKAYLPLLIIACGLFTWEFTSTPSLALSRPNRIVLTILAVINPVAGSQIFSTYTDSYIYYFVLLTLMASYEIYCKRTARIWYVILCTAIIMATGTKTNACFYEALIFVTILSIWYFYGNRSQLKRYAIWGFTAGIMGVILWAYHPYITNWITEGNPIYPHDSQAHEGLMCYAPEIFKSHNRVENFFISINAVEFPMRYYDVRIGGFGPLFSVIFYLTLTLNIIICIIKHRLLPISLFNLIIIVSCWIFVASWWARFYTHLWIIVPLTYLMLCDTRQYINIIGGGILFVVSLMNTFYVSLTDFRMAFTESVYNCIFYKHARNHTLKAGRMLNHAASQLDHHGGNYILVPEDSIPEERRLYFPLTYYFRTFEFFDVAPREQAAMKEEADSIFALPFIQRYKTFYEISSK